ncbi:MAG: cupin domain-containing protein [Gaiellaceae bacterium]
MSGYVIHEREVEPSRADGDTASVRLMIGRDTGSERLEQRIIRFAVGRSQMRGPDEGRQEILYVAAGTGSLLVQGSVHGVAAGTGIFVAAGERWKFENRRPEELVVVSVTAPQHAAPDVGRKITVSFDDQPELRADAKRTFRYLINQDAGCLDATQFVGLVQPFRAPDHSHHYDEVGYIVEGTGVAHIGDRRTLLEPGSCFHLPPELVHCIENNGDAVMRIMGVFHPSGDPASRAYDAAYAAS